MGVKRAWYANPLSAGAGRSSSKEQNCPTEVRNSRNPTREAARLLLPLALVSNPTSPALAFLELGEDLFDHRQPVF